MDDLLEIKQAMFDNIYCGKRVLVTGDSGFKGSWLCAWLTRLGAEVCGISLPMQKPDHSSLLALDYRKNFCDIRDFEACAKIFADFSPEVVFHLAAQPIVRLSYAEPRFTFETNVCGTVNILECCRCTASVKAVVVISSDKCYENRETLHGYSENDPMGGYDPYSASKGCTELTASCWSRSYFNPAEYGQKHHTLLASARAGNVIGGGDWALDRLVPDLMKDAAAKRVSLIRSPESVRPWQHVLEPLSGYLLLGQKLLEGDTGIASGWNFGPAENSVITVLEAATALQKGWSDIRFEVSPPPDMPHEAKLLMLNCAKAASVLDWHSVWSAQETFEMTSRWYRDFYTEGKLSTFEQLDKYICSATQRGYVWTK